MNLKPNSSTKNLVNVFGRIGDLKLENGKLLNIYKIPNHYQKYNRVSLYFGDWNRIECDCLYLKSRNDFERLLVLSKISNHKVPSYLEHNKSQKTDKPHEENDLIQCSEFIKNSKYIFFGNLRYFNPPKVLKSLLVPLDILHQNLEILQKTEEDNPNHLKELRDLGFSIDFVNSLENLKKLDKVLLCTGDNNLWNKYHKSLKY